MTDIAGTSLKEPVKLNWDELGKGSTFQAPPPAIGPDGKAITYLVQLPNTVGDPSQIDVTDDGYRRYSMGPLRIVKSGNGADGYEIKFYSTTLRPFTDKKTGEPLEGRKAGNLTASILKAAGINQTPQTTAQYDTAVKMLRGKTVPVTIEWTAKNRDTGETVDGFTSFPFDPDRPGQRKAILKAGDRLANDLPVTSEVLFANARVKFIQNPNRK